MTIAECEKRNQAVMKAFEEWKNGENYLDNYDLTIVCGMLNIKYPITCQKYLEYTDSPLETCTTTLSKQALKTIYNFLRKLKNMSYAQ